MVLTCFLILSWLIGISSAAPAQSTVPFIGCSSDGMMKMAAPTGKSISLNIPSNIASKLVVFAGAYNAVLGPRTWHCSGGLGNDSQALSVFPPGDSDDKNGLIRTEFWGEGSGYVQAMSIAGRYFPKLVNDNDIKKFMTEWGMDGVTEQQFIAPYDSASRLTYLSPATLAFETPPGKQGIEKQLGFDASTFPTDGILQLHLNPGNHDTSYLHFVVVRLSPKLSYLKPAILDFSKKCILHFDKISCTADATNGPAAPIIFP